MADPLGTSLHHKTVEKRLPRPTKVKNKTPAPVQSRPSLDIRVKHTNSVPIRRSRDRLRRSLKCR
eukprot:4933081-Pyramimonas_sp.AAC.1